MSDREATTTESRGPRWLGWALSLGVVAYAVMIHYGVGPVSPGKPVEWYSPRGFVNDWSLIYWILETPARSIVGLTLPALAATLIVFGTARSAVACALAAAGTVDTFLFLYYGYQFPFAWEFFHWRGSAVMALIGVFVGGTIAAPRLAASWLRLGWPLRLLVYVPIFAAVVAFVRNATGTNADLSFALSPWPAVPVFGIEVAAAIIMTWIAGMAIAASGAAASLKSGAANPTLLRTGSIALGFVTPAIIVGTAVALEVFPFSAGPVPLAVMCALGAPWVLGAAFHRLPAEEEGRQRRARHLAVGTGSIAFPLITALVMARFDYDHTRDTLAQEVIDGLQAYYAREEVYPETLDELVAANHLDSIPEPSIGFAFLYDASFNYQNFGTSYLLEFEAPRWVQCAYNPPWTDEDEDGEAVDEDESLAGAWSCPDKPPELW